MVKFSAIGMEKKVNIWGGLASSFCFERFVLVEESRLADVASQFATNDIFIPPLVCSNSCTIGQYGE